MTKKAKKPRQFWIVDGAHVYSNGKDALEDARQWGNEEIIHVQEVLDGEAPAPESDLSDDGGQPEFAELHYMSGISPSPILYTPDRIAEAIDRATDRIVAAIKESKE